MSFLFFSFGRATFKHSFPFSHTTLGHGKGQRAKGSTISNFLLSKVCFQLCLFFFFHFPQLYHFVLDFSRIEASEQKIAALEEKIKDTNVSFFFEWSSCIPLNFFSLILIYRVSKKQQKTITKKQWKESTKNWLDYSLKIVNWKNRCKFIFIFSWISFGITLYRFFSPSS